jgi:methionyl-tRNA formyltransferase
MMKHADAHQLTSLGPIKGLVILGGGLLLKKLCLWAKFENLPIKIITSPRHNLEVSETESLSDFLVSHHVDNISVENISHDSVASFLNDTRDYFYLSLGAAWIFKNSLIQSLFDNRLLNLHGTRLPQNRGGGGFSWQILMGNKFGFCCLHRVDGGIDTGEIIAFDEFLYPSALRKPIDYENYYIEKNLNFLCEFIDKVRAASLPLNPIRQSESFSTYWPRLNTEINSWLNWSWSPIDIEKFICAFDDPYAGAQTLLNGKKVSIKDVCLSPQDGDFHAYQSGIIYRKSKSWICVALNGSTLVVEGLYDAEGNNILSSIVVGDRFTTPASLLDSAVARPTYTPSGMK